MMATNIQSQIFCGEIESYGVKLNFILSPYRELRWLKRIHSSKFELHPNFFNDVIEIEADEFDRAMQEMAKKDYSGLLDKLPNARKKAKEIKKNWIYEEYELFGHTHYRCKKCGSDFCSKDVEWSYHECFTGDDENDRNK